MAGFEPGDVAVSGFVEAALAGGRGVVALESTLVAQGLPWPVNLETARGAEAAVRAAGAEPATIAVIGGVVRIGLTDSELELLAGEASRFVKAGRRELGIVTGLGRDAATTVGSTLFLARRAGIRVMATGGLGGVHRGAGETFDVSADLDELGRANGCLVVCAGVKSILDMSATLEALETRGVAVLGFRTNQWPAFTTVGSGLIVDWRADSAGEVVKVVASHRALGVPGAIVVGQPVLAELEIPRAEMEAAISGALADAACQGIAGKAMTPFLLSGIRRATAGRSLAANRALIEANARLAGEVAVGLAEAQSR